MKAYFEYRFQVTHDKGTFFTGVVSHSKESAINMLCNAENCPKRSLTFIRKIPITL